MTPREYMPEQRVVVTDNGEIAVDADFDELLPMANEQRIARMHPHATFEEEIYTYEDAISDEPSVQPDTSSSSIAPEVEEVKRERDAFREELERQGIHPTRIGRLVGRKFGRAITRLAQDGFNIDPLVGTVEEEETDTTIHYLHREPDVRERRVGPDY